MSRQDEPLTKAGIVWAVRQTLAGHVHGRWCPQCRPDGCEQLAWAMRERGAAKPVSPVAVLLARALP